MAGFNYFQFHIGDFITGCLHMDATEIGSYTMLLLAHYQAGESGLPDDDKKLARISKVSTKTWLRIKPIVMDKFYLESAFWKNSRVVEEFQKRSRTFSDQRARSLKRWNKRIPEAFPEPIPDRSITNNQQPITNTFLGESSPSEEKKIPKIKPEKGRRLETFLTSEFQSGEIPQEWGDWAFEKMKLSAEEINWEWGKFTDYWKSQSGAKGVKLDWPATWRNWMRKKHEDKSRKEKLNELYTKKSTR